MRKGKKEKKSNALPKATAKISRLRPTGEPKEAKLLRLVAKEYK